jgi:hypothetical protein
MSLRLAACGVAVFGVIAAVASCDDPNDGYYDRGRCDYVVDTQCQTVCNYQCDPYECYPVCYDQCYDQCGQSHRIPISDAGAVVDAATVTPIDAAAPPADGGTSSGGTGTGVLCSPCISNADCEKNALCILRGGPPRDSGADGGTVGNGFCGHNCTTSDDCPTGFLCSQIGATRQCLPTGNACE